MNVNKEPQNLSVSNDIRQASVSLEHDPSLMELDDLGLTDEQLDGVKAGRTGSEDGGGGGMGGDWVINHNETTDDDEEMALDDLGLTDEELDGIKGGTRPGGDDGGGGRTGGDWIINHNETTMSDEESASQNNHRAANHRAERRAALEIALVDLEPRAGIKGGTLPGIHKVSDVTLKRGVVG